MENEIPAVGFELLRNLELLKWRNVPEYLRGSSASDSDDISRIMKLPRNGLSRERRRGDFYRYRTDSLGDIAYECPHCGKIMIGPPKLNIKKYPQVLQYFCSNSECSELIFERS